LARLTPIIQLRDVHFTYTPENGVPVQALRGVTLDIAAGEYVAILGHNGSGKSTLARHLNALLLPTSGDVIVDGHSTRERKHLRTIRSTVGMVFQTPDNQIVATLVEEDVAFGPENLALPRDEIVTRVGWALDTVDIGALRKRAPHQLSGGQKQRVCIAGVFAMRPRVLVLDEATAMLDPTGRRDVLAAARALRDRDGAAIVTVTHLMDEAVHADRIIIMEAGRIALSGTPREIFAQPDALERLKMSLPQITQLSQRMHRRNPAFDAVTLSVDEWVATARRLSITPRPARSATPATQTEPIIAIKQLAHDYLRDTPMQHRALHEATFDVRPGEVLGVIGHTGSGKSTAIQHLNALLRPRPNSDDGEVFVFGKPISDPELDVRDVRRRVGLVFQQPETQLFEQFVGDDIAYGPRNLKLDKATVRERVRAAMAVVGLDFETFKDRMTFQLSGGEKRRVAIAGVLALDPDVVVLDEPTVGLDPGSRERLLSELLKLRDLGKTLILVSHNLEDLARICDRLCVFDRGRSAIFDTTERVFAEVNRLEAFGLHVPQVVDAFHRIGAGVCLDVDEALERLPS
jgi:energy-coupling factor transport system ATP-binding protein